MQDPPTPGEILGAVARFLRTAMAGEATGAVAFQARVAANAVEMTRRQIEVAQAREAAEHQRLTVLLGDDGDLAALNGELARRIRDGEMTLATPGLADHLWTVTLDKLAVDQPTYSGYRTALAERSAPNDEKETR
ncbi:MAG TPA: DUF6285 domain-containing protein [Caulobacteraceae bacterium]